MPDYAEMFRTLRSAKLFRTFFEFQSIFDLKAYVPRAIAVTGYDDFIEEITLSIYFSSSTYSIAIILR